jgi:hypothetical protein
MDDVVKLKQQVAALTQWVIALAVCVGCLALFGVVFRVLDGVSVHTRSLVAESLTINDDAGQPVVMAFAHDGNNVLMVMKGGRPRASLSVDDEGVARMGLRDESKERLVAMVGGNVNSILATDASGTPVWASGRR